jgi:Putative peptidoglycan binding domain
MKKYLFILILGSGCVIFTHTAQAQVIPTLTLTSQSSDSTTVSVVGAPNAGVTLYYNSTLLGLTSSGLGTTDQNGNFSTTLNPNTYNVSPGDTAYVIVDGAQSPTVSWPTSNLTGGAGLSLSQTSLTVNAGQSSIITITGSGSYYISSNSSTGVASASISGDNLTVQGLNSGGTNITICEDASDCASLYVYVSGSSVAAVTTTNQTVGSGVPLISSFNVSSNSAGGNFLGVDSSLTISFNTNEGLSSASVSVNGQPLSTSGVGAGPYSATYTINNSNLTSLPVSINLQALNQSNTLSFVLGALTATPVYTTTVAPVTSSANTSYKFYNPLLIGDSGVDVTALQERLTTEGVYSGPITGFFGALTEAAVKAFQTNHGLSPLGNVGPNTRALLNSGL